MTAKCKKCNTKINQYYEVQAKLSQTKIKALIPLKKRQEFMLSLMHNIHEHYGHFEINTSTDTVNIDINLLCNTHYSAFKKSLTRLIHKAVDNNEEKFFDLMRHNEYHYSKNCDQILITLEPNLKEKLKIV